MASSLPRRRSSAEAHQATRDPILQTQTSTKSVLSISPIFVLLLILTIWCASTLLSSSFHICVTNSRKLDLYCISGGLNSPHPGVVTLINSSEVESTPVMSREERNMAGQIANAQSAVREKVQLIRSWAAASNGTAARGSCDGRGVFVYDLPPKFNRDLVTQCGNLLPWTDLCDYFTNEGKGQPIPKLGSGWYRTHQYSLELIFHSRVLKHPCRVWSPDEARLFYVPFYGGFDILRWHFKNVSEDVVKDALGRELVRWLEGRSSWSRHGGEDHMFVLGKISWDFRRREGDSWGSRFLSMEEMRAPYKFLIERQPWEAKDIGIPHPTHFHPSGDADVERWQARVGSSKRRSLVTFAGGERPKQSESIRSLLIKNCVASSGDCRYEAETTG